VGVNQGEREVLWRSSLKKTFAHFQLSEADERWRVDSNIKSLSTEHLFLLWLYLIKSIIERPDIDEDKRNILRNVQATILSAPDNLATKRKDHTFKVITVYSRKDGRYMALEYVSAPGGVERSSWGVIDTYDKVAAAIKSDFGVMKRVPRDVSDAKDVLENWI
jgi:hypothetical protein